jgi:uncharacterized protein YyaL (SSP411 family)
LNIGILLTLLAVAPAGAPAHYEHLCNQVAASFDSARGGFVGRDGVPDESAVELALLQARASRSKAWKARALATIEWTKTLRDEVGGGYFHNAGSADPTQPFFDKRADSNALRLETLLLAWRLTGTAWFKREAAMVADYFERVLSDPAGGFTSHQAGKRRPELVVNGIATRAWLEWAAATRSPRHRDFALKTLDRFWKQAWSDERGLVRPAEAKNSWLEDQVEMGRAFVLAAHLCRRSRDLQRARALGNLLLSRFEDSEKGGFQRRAYAKANGQVARSGIDFAENARAVRFLKELSGLTGDRRYRQAADRAVARFERKLDQAKSAAADWALALRAGPLSDLTPAPAWAPVAGKTRHRRR